MRVPWAASEHPDDADAAGHTQSDPAKIVATVIGGFLLAGLQLFLSILDSLLIFGAIQSGADITYLQWLGWFGYVLLFNVLGGLVLVTALRLLRTKDLFTERGRALTRYVGTVAPNTRLARPSR